jgi:hypothetical protein
MRSRPAVLKVLDDPVTHDRLSKAGAVVAPLSQRRFSALYLGDIARWKKIIPAAKIKLD